MTLSNQRVSAVSEVDLTLGRRLADVAPSAILEVSRKVREMRAVGRDVIHLGAGIPTPSPAYLKQPIEIDPNLNQLLDPAGIPDLRAALSARLMADYGLAYDPASQIVVTVGAKQACHAALFALIDPGDEVAILDPAWVTYGPTVELAGGVAKRFMLDPARDYALDAEAVAAACGPKCRVIILNTPHNPTGRVFTRDELQAVADLAIARNLWVISDESFDKYVYDGRAHVCIASLPGMAERTVMLRSFSKAYGFMGGRVGYLAAPARVAALVSRYNGHVISCVSPILQSVACHLLAGEPDWTEELRAAYQVKRDVTAAAVNVMPGLSCAVPEGTFYIWADVRPSGMSATDFCTDLLEGAGIALTPGEAFGALGEGFVRFNLAGPMDVIEEGLERMGSYLKGRRA